MATIRMRRTIGTQDRDRFGLPVGLTEGATGDVNDDLAERLIGAELADLVPAEVPVDLTAVPPVEETRTTKRTRKANSGE